MIALWRLVVGVVAPGRAGFGAVVASLNSWSVRRRQSRIR
jgi:hypothetical protein